MVFDHFCISGSDGNDYKFGFGTYVTSNQKGPLSAEQRGPLAQIPAQFYPVRVLLRGVETNRHLNKSTAR
jgi:hypothetical protein